MTEPRTELYRPRNPDGRPGHWVDLTQFVVVLGSMVLAWFALLAPTVERVRATSDDRCAALDSLEVLERRVDLAHALAGAPLEAELKTIAHMVDDLRAQWRVARVSDRLLPVLENRSTGPSLVLTDRSVGSRDR